MIHFLLYFTILTKQTNVSNVSVSNKFGTRNGHRNLEHSEQTYRGDSRPGGAQITSSLPFNMNTYYEEPDFINRRPNKSRCESNSRVLDSQIKHHSTPTDVANLREDESSTDSMQQSESYSSHQEEGTEDNGSFTFESQSQQSQRSHRSGIVKCSFAEDGTVKRDQ